MVSFVYCTPRKSEIHLELLFAMLMIYENMQPEKVAFDLKLGQSKPIYNAFKEIQEGSMWETLNEAQQRVVEGSFKSKFV